MPISVDLPSADRVRFPASPLVETWLAPRSLPGAEPDSMGAARCRST